MTQQDTTETAGRSEHPVIAANSAHPRGMWLKRVQARVAYTLAVLSVTTMGFAALWHKDHLLMAFPFIILAVIPLVAAITLQLLDKAEGEKKQDGDVEISDDTHLSRFHQREHGQTHTGPLHSARRPRPAHL